MAIATGNPGAGLQRGRGGFMRATNDTPWVTHPTERKKDGTPKLTPYASPSGLGKLIENDTALVKWQQRKALRGLALDPTLYAQCAELLTLDEDSDEHRSLADSIVAQAKDLAEANLAAERGTHAHTLSEYSDEGRSWDAKAADGELLGIPADVQADLVARWQDLLADNDLEVLAVEATVVDDLWRTAGSLDRIVRLGRDLRFANPATGEIVVVPAGTVVVLDVKTSKVHDGRDPFTYWRGYTIQIATYAQGRPYDTETGERGDWPWPIDQDHALIARPNLTEVLAGTAERIEWTLIHADLVAGREHGGACVQQAKAWAARSDLFSHALAIAAPDDTTHGAPVEQPDTEGTTVPPPSVPSVSPSLTPAEQHAAVATAPDEGGPVTDAEFEALRALYMALPEGIRRAEYARIVEQAIQHRVSFHLNEARTVRRFEIVRGLVHLAAHDSIDDDTLRALLYADDLLGEPARYPAVTVGHLVGSLDHERAALFARRCHALIDGQLVGHCDAAGHVALQPAA